MNRTDPLGLWSPKSDNLNLGGDDARWRDARERGNQAREDLADVTLDTSYGPGPGEEWHALWNPWDAGDALGSANDARAVAEDAIPGRRGLNDRNDAIRHIMWSFFLTLELGDAEECKEFTDAHERSTGNRPAELLMDLTNNAVGRNLAELLKKEGMIVLITLWEWVYGLDFCTEKSEKALEILRQALLAPPGGAGTPPADTTYIGD